MYNTNTRNTCQYFCRIHRILVIYSYLQPSWNGTEIFLTVAEWCSYMVTGFVVILKLPFQQQESNPSHPFLSYMSRQLLVLKITVRPLFLARLFVSKKRNPAFYLCPATADSSGFFWSKDLYTHCQYPS